MSAALTDPCFVLERRLSNHSTMCARGVKVQFFFGNHKLDTDRRELHRGSTPVAVEPQVFDLLKYLVENRDRVVSKDDLIASVWVGRNVSDSTLSSRINAARRAIGDNGDEQKLIRTIPRRGVRFVADVSIAPVQSETAPVSAQRTSSMRSDRPSVAVLPFVNVSGEPNQDYFADGISEDIITALSKVRWFFVIARNSSFIYKGQPVNTKKIGAELGVDYLIEGSVRKSGDRVRITAQLNDTAIGNQLWSERYDRQLAGVFDVQDEITEAVVAAIEPQIYAAENFRARRKAPENLDAWGLVMRALSHYWSVPAKTISRLRNCLSRQLPSMPTMLRHLPSLPSVTPSARIWVGRMCQPLFRSPNARDWRLSRPTAKIL